MLKRLVCLAVVLGGLTGQCYGLPLFETEGVCPDAYQMDRLTAALKTRAQSAATKDGQCVEWMVSHCRCRADRKILYIMVYYPCDASSLGEADSKKRDRIMEKPTRLEDNAQGSQCGGCMGSATTSKDKVIPGR